MDVKKYRLSHYNYKAWGIQQWIPPTKKKDGFWKFIKYPGTMQNAVNGLIDLHIPNTTYEDVKAVETALSTARDEIMAGLSEMIHERDRN